jgi:hypothetical protein
MSKNGPSSYAWGYIDRFDRFGLGFVKIDEMNRYLPFTFNQLHNYKGEWPREYGLYEGCPAMILFKRELEIEGIIIERKRIHPWLKRIYGWLRI